jgi:hypothetical protein
MASLHKQFEYALGHPCSIAVENSRQYSCREWAMHLMLDNSSMSLNDDQHDMQRDLSVDISWGQEFFLARFFFRSGNVDWDSL